MTNTCKPLPILEEITGVILVERTNLLDTNSIWLGWISVVEMGLLLGGLHHILIFYVAIKCTWIYRLHWRTKEDFMSGMLHFFIDDKGSSRDFSVIFIGGLSVEK